MIVGNFGKTVGILIEHSFDRVIKVLWKGFGLYFINAIEKTFDLDFFLLGEKEFLVVISVLHGIL